MERWSELECETRICTMARNFSATAFSRPASIYGMEAITVASESPDIGSRSGDPLLAGR